MHSDARMDYNCDMDGDDEELPWPFEELSRAETWWLVLGSSVNVSQIGDTTWNRFPTRHSAPSK